MLFVFVFLRPIAALLSRCPPFFGIVISMTFVCALMMARLLSGNFITISMITTTSSDVENDVIFQRILNMRRVSKYMCTT